MKHVCEVGDEAVLTTTVEAIELICECIEVRFKNMELSEWTTGINAKHVEACAAGRTMRGHLETVKRQKATI